MIEINYDKEVFRLIKSNIYDKMINFIEENNKKITKQKTRLKKLDNLYFTIFEYQVNKITNKNKDIIDYLLEVIYASKIFLKRDFLKIAEDVKTLNDEYLDILDDNTKKIRNVLENIIESKNIGEDETIDMIRKWI